MTFSGYRFVFFLLSKRYRYALSNSAAPHPPLYLHGKLPYFLPIVCSYGHHFSWFFRDNSGCMGFKEICPDVPKYTVCEVKCSGLTQIVKI